MSITLYNSCLTVESRIADIVKRHNHAAYVLQLRFPLNILS